MLDNFVGLLVVLDVPSVVPKMLVILKSASSSDCILPMMVFPEMWTVLCSVLSRGRFSNLG